MTEITSTEAKLKLAMMVGLCLGAFGVGIPDNVPLVKIGIFALGVISFLILQTVTVWLLRRIRNRLRLKSGEISTNEL